MPRRNFRAVMIVLGLSLAFWQTSSRARPRDDMMELYGLFVDAVEQVEANYVRPVSRKELLETALKGMLQNLDEHSTYFSESDYKQFQKDLGESFSGIGVSIAIDPESGRLKILAPLVGGPAYAAGVMAGDVVLEIDEKSTEGWHRDKAVEALTGRVGTQVKLNVLHVDAEKSETISITRATIELPSILGDIRKPDDSWDYMLDKDQKIAYVRLNGFYGDTDEDLHKVLDELKEQGMKGLILDLRNNPGGRLDSAVEISDMFVEDGMIVSTKGRNTKTTTHPATKGGIFDAEDGKGAEVLPVAVLINENSASASEILSSCLQDHQRAKIVGRRSFGKGSVQHVIQLQEGDSALKLTVATYWRPSGKNIHRFRNAKPSDEWGVTPDQGYDVKLTPDEFDTWYDARRDRDLISSHTPEKLRKEAEGKAFVDTQRDKALEFVRDQVKAAAAK